MSKKFSLLLSYLSVVFLSLLIMLLIGIISVKSFFLFLGIGFVISFFAWYIFLRRVNLPMKEIIRISKKFSQGDFSDRIYLKQENDEFAELANNLNQIAEQIQLTINSLNQEIFKREIILSNMAEAVIAIDDESKIIFVNSASEKIFNFSQPLVIGEYLWKVIRNEELLNLFSLAKSNGKILNQEINFYFPFRKIFRVSISSFKIKNRSSGLVMIFHDITELKKLEQVKIDFVANVSHELRTPLTNVKGYIETLKNGAINDLKVAKEFLEILDQQTDKINNIINDLLLLSHLESGEANISLTAVDVSEVVRKVFESFRDRIEEKKLKLNIKIPSQLSPVKANRNYLEQVFNNLLDNAIKFTPAGGEINISARSLGNKVEMEVKDNGIGISQDDLERVFERFYQVDKERSPENKGTGLGLSIVKHIIRIFGGQIDVESELGKGTRFYFTLPFSEVH